MNIDINVLRKQMEYKLSNFKRRVYLRKQTVQNSDDYENEGLRDIKSYQEIDLFMMTDNSDQFVQDVKGRMLRRTWHAYSLYFNNILADDFIILDEVTYKVENLKRIFHPVTGLTIALEFDLNIAEVEEYEDFDSNYDLD